MRARNLISWAATVMVLTLSGCGGGGGGNLSGSNGNPTPADNTVAVTVDTGPLNNNINTLFVSVTFCTPGSTTGCQTVDHIQVDSGSYGLRVLATAISPLALPLQTATGGGSLVECTTFVDGYSWGPVVLADVTLGSQKAASVPVQVIGDARYPNVPSDCAATGPTEEDSVAAFGANGILGVGPFIEDCGPNCASQAVPTTYYACTGSTAATCTATSVAVANQVQSVIAKFSSDNNGVVIKLPAVSGNSTSTLSGTMYFGVDTETNNTLGAGAVALTLNDIGNLIVQYKGAMLTDSFIDSGSNATFFTDANIASCTQSGITDFYCPGTTQNLTAILQGQNGTMSTQNFTVANAFTVLSAAPQTDSVFPTIAGPFPGSNSSFDFGLPFFYGKTVAVQLENATTTLGSGALIAF